MRTKQITFCFDDQGELDELWETIPLTQRTEIARGYARLLVKAAKVQLPSTEKEGEGYDK